MPCMTVEPFTAGVLLANVDHVSSLLGIHGELMLLAQGRATASALSGRETSRHLYHGAAYEMFLRLKGSGKNKGIWCVEHQPLVWHY